MNLSILEFFLSLIILALLSICILSGRYLHYKSLNLSFANEMFILKDKILLFYEKFLYFPGDYPLAKDIWGNSVNGNGDGYVHDKLESLYAWQHLEKANMIHTNLTYDDSIKASKGNNMIASKYNDCAYQILADSKLNHINIYIDKKFNYLRIGLDKSYGNLYNSCITSNEAQYIDSKYDDARPLYGKILSDFGSDIKYDDQSCLCGSKINKHLMYYCANDTMRSCIIQMKLR